MVIMLEIGVGVVLSQHLVHDHVVNLVFNRIELLKSLNSILFFLFSHKLLMFLKI